MRLNRRVIGLLLFLTVLMGAGSEPAQSIYAEHLPGVQERQCNVMDYGAAGDLKTLDTAALQSAIDDCHHSGGGTVIFPSGYQFLSGTLVLRSNVTLDIRENALLRGSRDLADYTRTVPDLASYAVVHYSDFALIQAIGQENIEIKGKGIIDGDGIAIPGRTGHGHYKVRPYILRFVRSKHVRVRDVTLMNPNFWTQYYLEVDHLHIDGVTVRSMNLDPHQPNGDGVNIDGCRHVLIENMDIESEDDGIVLKSTSLRPMYDVLIRNNRVRSNVNAIKIGTETHGIVRDVHFLNNRVIFAGRAALTVQSVDGAHVENIHFEHTIIDEAAVPIFLRLGNRGRRIGFMDHEDKPEPGIIRNIVFRDIKALRAGEAMPPKVMPRSVGSAVSGIEGHRIQNIVLEDLDLTFAGGLPGGSGVYPVPDLPDRYPNPEMFGILPASAFYFRHVDGLTMNRVYIGYEKADYRPALFFENTGEVSVSQVYVPHPKGEDRIVAGKTDEGTVFRVTAVEALNRYRIDSSESGL